MALSVFLSGCSHVDPGEKTQRGRTRPGPASRFEWAVQHYEAGDYDRSVREFTRLREAGPAVPEFDLLPFYLGMSLYRLARYPEAARELEAFARTATLRPERQDGRVALLLCYEKLGRWQDVSAVAAETDKLILFQNNRALLKLVWARALREGGEILGARAALEEASPYLNQVADDDRATPFYADADKDLWGRYFFTRILIQELECRRAPRDLPGRGKGRPRHLYGPWLDGEADCYRKLINLAGEELFVRESPWVQPAEALIGEGVSGFAGKIRGYLEDERGSVARRADLQRLASRNFYRILSTIEDHIKSFKNKGLNQSPLESLHKRIDGLLVGFSSSS